MNGHIRDTGATEVKSVHFGDMTSFPQKETITETIRECIWQCAKFAQFTADSQQSVEEPQWLVNGHHDKKRRSIGNCEPDEIAFVKKLPAL